MLKPLPFLHPIGSLYVKPEQGVESIEQKGNSYLKRISVSTEIHLITSIHPFLVLLVLHDTKQRSPVITVDKASNSNWQALKGSWPNSLKRCNRLKAV